METKQYEDLIAKAKQSLITGKPKATKEDKLAVEAADPLLANELLAERESLVDQIKLLTVRKEEIEDIIRDAIGAKPSDEKKSLLIHGATVATMTFSRSTVLNTKAIKEQFDVLEYPEFYTRKTTSRLTIN
jgi:hypothetical protein